MSEEGPDLEDMELLLSLKQGTIARQRKDIEELEAILDSTEDCRLLRRQENIIAQQQAVIEKLVGAASQCEALLSFKGFPDTLKRLQVALAEAEKLK